MASWLDDFETTDDPQPDRPSDQECKRLVKEIFLRLPEALRPPLRAFVDANADDPYKVYLQAREMEAALGGNTDTSYFVNIVHYIANGILPRDVYVEEVYDNPDQLLDEMETYVGGLITRANGNQNVNALLEAIKEARPKLNHERYVPERTLREMKSDWKGGANINDEIAAVSKLIQKCKEAVRVEIVSAPPATATEPPAPVRPVAQSQSATSGWNTSPNNQTGQGFSGRPQQPTAEVRELPTRAGRPPHERQAAPNARPTRQGGQGNQRGQGRGRPRQ